MYAAWEAKSMRKGRQEVLESGVELPWLRRVEQNKRRSSGVFVWRPQAWVQQAKLGNDGRVYCYLQFTDFHSLIQLCLVSLLRWKRAARLE